MSLLTSIKASPTLVQHLAWPFDFDVAGADQSDPWYTLSPKEVSRTLAVDGSGGTFDAVGSGDLEALPILYVSSEGEAGCIAQSLPELIAMLLNLPYWRDLLKFSGGGSLDEMRNTELPLRKEYQADAPDLPTIIAKLESILVLPKLPDPIAALHASVAQTPWVVSASDGSQCASLFGNFTAQTLVKAT